MLDQVLNQSEYLRACSDPGKSPLLTTTTSASSVVRLSLLE